MGNSNINKLICPYCQDKGVREVLGELDSEGNLIIRRITKRGIKGTEYKTTRIISPILVVQCGNCGEVVFYRKRK